MEIRVINPFRLNDWDIKPLLWTYISWITLAVTMVCLDQWGYSIPLVRSIVVGLFMVSAPGFLILRALRLNDMGVLKTVLLAVGLSLATLMGCGFLVNLIYAQYGWGNAFSVWTVLGSIIAIVFVLLIIVYFRDDGSKFDVTMDLKPFVSIHALILYCLPFLAIISTNILNRTGANGAQLALIIVIGVGMVVYCWSKKIPKVLYPIAIFSFSLALLWHSSFVSELIVEWADVSFEFWSAKQTLITGMWEPTPTNRTDNLLSLAVLVPMIAVPADIDLIIFFKMVFPLLFTLVPIGVYQLATRGMDPRLAMLATFIIISLSSFYTDMLGLNRQMISELFMVLIIIILVDINMSVLIKMGLLLTFGLSLAVSHYGLLMIFVVCFVISSILLILASAILRRHYRNFHVAALLTVGLIVFTALWYTLILNSYITQIVFDAFGRIFMGIWSIHDVQSGLLARAFHFSDLNLIDQVNLIVFISVFILSTIGIAQQMIKKLGDERFEMEYTTLAIAFLLVIIMGIITPNIFGYVSESRLVHIAMLVLSPFVVVGGRAIVDGLVKRVVRPFKGAKYTGKQCYVYICSLAIVLILFTNSGLINELAGEPVAFELNVWDERPNFNNMEGNAAKWAEHMIGDDQIIKADANRAYLVKMYTGDYIPLYTTNGVDPNLVHPQGTFYYLGTENVNGMIRLEDPVYFRVNKTLVPVSDWFSSYLYNQNMVYNGEYSLIYHDR